MRKMLTLLTTITWCGIVSTNIMACTCTNPKPSSNPNPSIPIKIDLKAKITTLKINTIIKIDTNKTNKQLDSIIMDAEQIINLIPPLQNPIIKYFSDAQGKTDVSNQKQKSGYLYVVITANDNDLNYQGATKPIKIIL